MRYINSHYITLFAITCNNNDRLPVNATAHQRRLPKEKNINEEENSKYTNSKLLKTHNKLMQVYTLNAVLETAHRER